MTHCPREINMLGLKMTGRIFWALQQWGIPDISAGKSTGNFIQHSISQ